MRSIIRLGVAVVAGAAAFSVLAAPAAQADGNPVNIAAKSLPGYKHVGQGEDWWCGPATAYIMIKGMKHYGKISTTDSSLAGSALTQSRLASDSYLKANGGGGTQRADMRNGINKWIGHNWFNILNEPTPAEFKAKLVNNIGKGYAVAVAAYEPAGERHYNGHPVNQSVDHWVVARGYTTDVSKTHFIDPATTVWSAPEPYFSHYTNSFVNLFVRPSKAIVW